MRLGCDPEVFLVDTNGVMRSAIGLIGADKWNPLQIKGMSRGFTLQEDNVALEYGIPPAATEDEFVHHIFAVMEKSKDWIGKLTFSKLSCSIFPKEEMTNPAAYAFGCEPDFNAWTGEPNFAPHPPHERMRSAGGHIHVETSQGPMDVAQKMDLFLTVPSLLMDTGGKERRQLYGKKGAYRPKPYGVEYRSLSNFWIFDEKYVRWVWRNTTRALAAHKSIVADLEPFLDIAINENDLAMAQTLVEEFELEVI